jgi:hypothetical protein
LARRGYGDPNLLRWSLTDAQLQMYVDFELEARADEVGLTAYATLAAIGEAFGAKGAVKKLVKAMHRGTKSGGSDLVRTLRHRMAGLVNIKDKSRGGDKK